MSLEPLSYRQAAFSSLVAHTSARYHRRKHRHTALNAFSRRKFLQATVGATGLILASGVFSSAFATTSPEPTPIPGGNQFLLPDDATVFHVLLPGLPGFPNNDPATNDTSLITDFNGHIGLAYVHGMGTRTDLTTGEERYLPFDVDLRFMKGEYVGADGMTHSGAFALV